MSCISSRSSEMAVDRCRLRLRISRIVAAGRDAKIFALASNGELPLPAVAPGASINLHLPDGLQRAYSVLDAASAPAEYRICVKREPNSRGGSRYLHEACQAGNFLTADSPISHFKLVEDAEYSVFFAGGIGITPIYNMLNRLRVLGRPFHLHYAARSPESAALYDELSRIDGASFYFSAVSGGRRLSIGNVVAALPKATHLYCCGPASMLADFRQASAERPMTESHIESFQPADDNTPAMRACEVYLARSGRTIQVSARESILAALLAHGVGVPHSCRQGTCGACEVDVLEGIPEHRDYVLTEAERRAGKTIFVCCSGARSDRLVLDL